MPMPPRPEPNQARAVANDGIERTPPTSAAIGLSATTAIHNAPNDTPRITSDIAAVIHEVRVSMLGVIQSLFRSSPRKRGPSPWPWIPACAGMSGACSTLRRKAERLLEARRVARPDFRIEHALHWLAIE